MTPAATRSIALQVGIAAAAVILVVLTWAFTLVSINTEARQAQTHAESNVTNLALAVEWQLVRQLQAIDQTMQSMAAEWRGDPIHFDPSSWKRRSNLLGEVSLQVYLLDTAGFVMASTRHDLMGTDLSSRDYFQAQVTSRRSGLFIGPAIRWLANGRWEINLSRRLERANGSFAGVIVVSYDPWILTSMLEQVDLGPRGLIALVGSDGAIRALVSPYEVRPGEDIATSSMFREGVLADGGTWTGPSAPDQVVRIHAIRHLREQDLTILVGVDRAVALQAAQSWAANARTFAACFSLALLLMAWLLVREVRAARVREQRLADNQAVLQAAYTDLKAATEGSQAKTAQLVATLSGMSDGVMLLDANLRLLQWNERFPAFTGVPPEMLKVGVSMYDILVAQAKAGEFGRVDPAAEAARRIALLQTHQSLGTQERTRPNGRTMEMRRSAVPGGGFVTLYTDITARKQAELAQTEARRLAEEAMAQKSRFVAVVSHEIRTPLNAVVNSLALLDQSGLSASQRRLADTARQAGEALLDLVRDILDLSKADAGRLTLRPSVFELGPLLDGVREMFRAQAAARRVQLVVDVAADLPAAIRADRGRLRQVVMNLVSNAAKFANPGTVTIRAAVTMASGRPELLLGVADEGPRIPEAQAAKLFQPFSRLDNAQANAAQGTGLGLAICERLTRLMGGHIGLGPSAAGGNEFWLTLPLERATPLPAPAANAAPVVIMPARWRRASVLLVEDLVPNQIVTATMLRREGHRVDIADCGVEALRMVQSQHYDLVFMDLSMPGMSGYEAAKRIRELPAPACNLPIVALTANTAPEDRARCLAAGMNDLLGKPVQSAELTNALVRTVWPAVSPAQMKQAMAQPAAAPVSSDGPALDPARLQDLQRGLPRSTLVPLVEQCLADMRERLPLLQQALQAEQSKVVEANAHAIAGMAGNFGLAVVEKRMRRIMAAARGGDLSPARSAAEGMDTELARAGDAIRQAILAA